MLHHAREMYFRVIYFHLWCWINIYQTASELQFICIFGKSTHRPLKYERPNSNEKSSLVLVEAFSCWLRSLLAFRPEIHVGVLCLRLHSSQRKPKIHFGHVYWMDVRVRARVCVEKRRWQWPRCSCSVFRVKILVYVPLNINSALSSNVSTTSSSRQ